LKKNPSSFRKIVFIICTLSFSGCSESLFAPSPERNVSIVIDARLPMDSNGYYHLDLNTGRWQTIHRISGQITYNEKPAELFKAYWRSSHLWIIGNPIGYIVDIWNCYGGGCDNPWEAPRYVGLDTLNLSQFEGMEVPTINSASYSDDTGEINTIFAPVQSMAGDTVIIFAYTIGRDHDQFAEAQPIGIILH